MEMWKICLVLNNPIRFALLREIMFSPGRVQNVVQAGERLGIKKSLASQYLKSFDNSCNDIRLTIGESAVVTA